MTDIPTTEAGRLDAAWEAFLLALWNDLNQDSWKAAYIWHRPIIEAEARGGLDVTWLALALERQAAAFLEQPESFDNRYLIAEFIAAEYAALARQADHE